MLTSANVLVSGTYGHAFHLSTPKTPLRWILAVLSFYRSSTACASPPTNSAVSIGPHMQQNNFSLFAATSKWNLSNVDQEYRRRFPLEHSCPFCVSTRVLRAAGRHHVGVPSLFKRNYHSTPYFFHGQRRSESIGRRFFFFLKKSTASSSCALV